MLGESGGPLSGLVVADFSRILAGPYATMLLADMGATVIKVESPRGDDTRTWMPPTRDGAATYFLGVNRNKYSIALDLKDAEDHQRAVELVTAADVLIENFRPGSLAQFGLDYPSASRMNPRLVYASITGFGPNGGAKLPGYDLMVQAISGLMSLTGELDGPPYRAGMSVFDIVTGLHATIGILSALHERERSGLGQHVEANLLASALSGMSNQVSAYIAGGEVPHRMGNAHRSLFPYEPLPAADGEIIIIAGNDGQFATLCTVLGIPEVAADPRFSTNIGRTEHRAELREILVDRLRTRTKQEWFDLLTRSGLACGPINSVAEGVAFAESIGLEPVVEAGTGDTAIPTVRNPLTFSRSTLSYELPPPGIDEHRDMIAAWLHAGAQPVPLDGAHETRRSMT